MDSSAATAAGLSPLVYNQHIIVLIISIYLFIIYELFFNWEFSKHSFQSFCKTFVN